MTAKFKPGDLVWAKLRYCPAWPAKVVDPPLGTIKKNSYYVFFYGSENFGWIKNSNIRSYKKNYEVKRDVRNSLYRKAVQQVAEIYHEYQLQNDYDFINAQKPKRSIEEEEERSRKIQERLKVRLFPKKSTKKKANKKKIEKGKKSSVIEAASVSSSSIPPSSSSIPPSSSSIPPSSSCIITVNVRDYKKIIPNEAVVLLQRCDEGLPSLICDSDEPECGCEEDQPPTLLPEL